MLRVHHSRIHTLNEKFFSIWSKNSAYVFGFWMADGYIHHDRHYKISISSNDLGHLEQVKEVIGSNKKIYHDKRSNCHELYVYSKYIFEDLIKLGGSTKKSNTLKFPIIPDQFMPDFIRGYFDGDGSVHYISYKATKNGKEYTETRSNFTCGSLSFLISLRGILAEKLGLSFRVIGQYGPHQFKLGYGQSDTIKLLEYMYYPNHEISMKRKAKYLKKHLRKKAQTNPRSGLLTRNK